MMHEVQMHFRNGGHVLWFEEIEDEDDWISETLENRFCTAWDHHTERHFAIRMDEITAIVLTKKEPEERRLYAPQTGKVESLYQE